MQRPYTESAALVASRPIFLCFGCYDAFVEAGKRWWHQIERPKHADDEWKPSIAGHVWMNMMNERAEQRMREPQQIDVPDDFVPGPRRNWNPQQRAAAEHVRRVMRQDR